MRENNADIEFGVMNNLGIAIYGKTLGIIGTGTIDGRIAMCHCCCDNINWFLQGEHHKMTRVN